MASMEQQPKVKDTEQTTGEIKNSIANRNQLQLFDTKNWSGSMATDYPKTITNGQTGKFVQVGAGDSGSKGGVIYADNSTPTPRKWLVAYHTPFNRVYVEAGANLTNWDNVLLKLSMSSNTSIYTDPKLGGRAEAGIMPNGNLQVNFTN